MGAGVINRCVVTVNRAPSVTIADSVFEYEVAVLEEIHGEQSVQVVSTKSVPVPEDFGAADAFAQLLRKYSDEPGKAAVYFVYRNVAALSKTSGLPYSKGDEADIKYEQASIIVHPEDPAASVLADASSKVAQAQGK